MLLAAVYQIVHIETNRCYVGHSVRFRIRLGYHRRLLVRGLHHAPRLQRAWNKHGASAFAFRFLEVCPADQKLMREQFYIDTLDSVFNYAKVAGSRLGVPQSLELIEDLRQRMLGNQHSLGRKHPPDEIERRASFHRGRKRSDEGRARISVAMKGKQNCLGRVGTKQMKQKISAANKGRRNTPEQEARRIVSRRSHSVINEADVLEIRASTAKGGVLAAQYGISQALVSMIRTGKRWPIIAQLQE